MRKPVIDGERWIAERLKFLKQRLSENPSDDERRAIEVEIQALSKASGIMLLRPGADRPERKTCLLAQRGEVEVDALARHPTQAPVCL